MLLRPFLSDATSCASYAFGCGTHAKLATVCNHGAPYLRSQGAFDRVSNHVGKANAPRVAYGRVGATSGLPTPAGGAQ